MPPAAVESIKVTTSLISQSDTWASPLAMAAGPADWTGTIALRQAAQHGAHLFPLAFHQCAGEMRGPVAVRQLVADQGITAGGGGHAQQCLGQAHQRHALLAA